MPYSDVATIGGVPNGTIIPQTEVITRNGLSYTVTTNIIYVDDPFNGSGPPNDTDYKRVEVQVSWGGISPSRNNPITLTSDISPNAASTSEGGTMVLLVFDANGSPVSGANITVEADSLTPPVNLTLTTGSDGQITIPGAPPCIACYRITVSKSGYSTDRTYSTSEVANPIKPDTSVFLESITQLSFAIDTLSDLTISSFDTRDNGFTPISDIAFNIHGNKIIGTDAYAQPVYKYDEPFTTDGSGNKVLDDIEWDVYRVTLTDGSYDIAGNSPIQPINLSPGVTETFGFTLNPHYDHSFLLSVKDPSQNLIASASARLFDGAGYDTSKFTGQESDPDFGQVYFGDLIEQSFQIEASAAGYTIFSGNFDISGSTTGEIVLIPE